MSLLVRLFSYPLKGIKAHHDNWVRSGSAADALKDFFNCRSEPLQIFPMSGIVIHEIPPPSLHLKIGIVNSLWDRPILIFPKAAEWANIIHIVKYFVYLNEGKQHEKCIKTQIFDRLLLSSSGERGMREWGKNFSFR